MDPQTIILLELMAGMLALLSFALITDRAVAWYHRRQARNSKKRGQSWR